MTAFPTGLGALAAFYVRVGGRILAGRPEIYDLGRPSLGEPEEPRAVHRHTSAISGRGSPTSKGDPATTRRRAVPVHRAGAAPWPR